MLRETGIAREPMVDAGLRYVRRTHPRGHHYFVVNQGDHPVDGWVTLGTRARSAVILDPRFEACAGVASLRHDVAGAPQIYLQMQPGESRIVRTMSDQRVAERPWRAFQSTGEPHPISGLWQIRFLEGGPELPAALATPDLASWTVLGGVEAQRFAGTACYTIDFEHRDDRADDWLLDLGRVCESARVRLNGRFAGTAWCAPFQLSVGALLRPGRNRLEVEVTNLAANRIADLDRRGVEWKAFHEINFVNRDYKPFDASTWPLRDSGLLGPVRLLPMKYQSLASELERA
jgi:hypothetical protein